MPVTYDLMENAVFGPSIREGLARAEQLTATGLRLFDVQCLEDLLTKKACLPIRTRPVRWDGFSTRGR